MCTTGKDPQRGFHKHRPLFALVEAAINKETAFKAKQLFTLEIVKCEQREPACHSPVRSDNLAKLNNLPRYVLTESLIFGNLVT